MYINIFVFQQKYLGYVYTWLNAYIVCHIEVSDNDMYFNFYFLLSVLVVILNTA